MSKTSEFFLFMDAAGPVPDAVCENKIADAVIYHGIGLLYVQRRKPLMCFLFLILHNSYTRISLCCVSVFSRIRWDKG